MRKEKIVTIQDEGRDKGKTFVLTEMSARQAEKWADRVFLAIGHANIDLPTGFGSRRNRGMEDLRHFVHLVSGIRFPELEPLMDELMGCVRCMPDPKHPNIVRPLVDLGSEGDDIEEVSTRRFLRQEVIDLHTGFLLPAAIFNLIAAGSELEVVRSSSATTPTSPKPSRSPSRTG